MDENSSQVFSEDKIGDSTNGQIKGVTTDGDAVVEGTPVFNLGEEILIWESWSLVLKELVRKLESYLGDEVRKRELQLSRRGVIILAIKLNELLLSAHSCAPKNDVYEIAKRSENVRFSWTTIYIDCEERKTRADWVDYHKDSADVRKEFIDSVSSLIGALVQSSTVSHPLFISKDRQGMAIVGRPLDGIGNERFLNRANLVEKVWSAVLESNILVICSPPATGKTSLLQLILRKFPEECYYVSFSKIASTRSAAEVVEAVIRSAGKDRMTILIDDAHSRYGEMTFWTGLIKVPDDLQQPNIRYIISATYKLYPNLKSPVAFSQLRRFKRDDLLVTDDECRLVLSWHLPSGLQYPRFLDLVAFETAGHIGAAMAAAMCLRDNFHHISNVTEEELTQFYFSEGLLERLDRCFGHFRISPESPKLRSILTDALLIDRKFDLNVAGYGVDDLSLLKNLRRVGILMDDSETSAKFCSPLARRFALHWLFPDRPQRNPSSIRELLENALSKISSEALRSSMIESRFPSEAAFQTHFLHAFISSTPFGCRIVPELSILFRDENGERGHRISGRIDFFVNHHLNWGVELLRNGEGVGEHVMRFAPGGKYESLAVADYIVIDLRDGPIQTNVFKHEKKSTVFFDESFKFSEVVHGFEKDAKRIVLKN